MANKKRKFFIVNTKLQSDKTEDARLKAYNDIIHSLTEKRRFVKTGKNEAITLYKPYKREENGITYYYGQVGKGIYFDRAEITVLKESGFATEVNEGNRLIEPVITDYIFIPSIHRFGLLKKEGSVNVNDFVKFLTEEMPLVVKKDEKIEVVLERNDSIIKEIFEAKVVYELKYEISYTNNDALRSQGELLDELLKRGNIGNLKVDARTDHSEEGLNLDEVPFLGGGIELARNNGTINRARILPGNGRKPKSISNNESPKIETFEIPEGYENENTLWFRKLLSLHLNGNRQ